MLLMFSTKTQLSHNKTILVMNNAYCTRERNCVYFIGLKVILSTWYETPRILSNFFLLSFVLTQVLALVLKQAGGILSLGHLGYVLWKTVLLIQKIMKSLLTLKQKCVTRNNGSLSE